MKNKKGLKVFIIVAIVAVFLGGKEILSKDESESLSLKDSLALLNEFSGDYSEDYYDDSEDYSDDTFTRIFNKSLNKGKEAASKGTKSPYVSVIYITGVISEENKTYNQKWLLRQIKNAQNDKNNRGILLKIDSPGGTVYESDEAYLALEEYKRATERPVFAYFGSLAASGGYYIGCSANYIYANRNTLTGSIGVIAGQSVDATGLLEKMGVKMHTITAGRNKNMGNYNAPLTEEQRAIMQSIADEAYEQFTGIVADARDLPIETVKELADGRIYTAKQAEENGLVDDVCSYEDAKDDIRDYYWGGWESDDSENAENTKESNDSKKKKGEDVNFVEYKYHYEENWMSLLYGASSFVKNPEASVYELLGNTGAKCLYLYQ